MKSLWKVVLPILRCWRILVPVKMIPGFDDAFNKTEVQVRRPEQIVYHGLPGAVADVVLDVSFVFQPP
jgi:hypothetical protein